MNNEVPVDRRGLMDEVAELIQRSRVAISPSELSSLAFEDFGLGNPRIEGFGYVDILRTIALRITILALLPGQTLPEHFHPPYDGHIGKEETLRVVYGETRIYIPGEKNNEAMIVPAGKEAYYKALHEIRLHRGEQYTVNPSTPHWFQGGTEGSVNLVFQNRVDESKNVFTDPDSLGCRVPGPQQQATGSPPL